MGEVTMENLELVFAFEDWAGERGYSVIRTPDKSQYASFETNAAWLGFEAAHGEAGCKPYGQQLYAHLKKSSEYAHQTDKLFPVSVGKAPYDDFVVHGGPGGVYRIRDVNFYVVSENKQYRLT
jgi:hypothetical protein